MLGDGALLRLLSSLSPSILPHALSLRIQSLSFSFSSLLAGVLCLVVSLFLNRFRLVGSKQTHTITKQKGGLQDGRERGWQDRQKGER